MLNRQSLANCLILTNSLIDKILVVSIGEARCNLLSEDF